MKRSKGCVQIYTGSGKGKTTAALGQALRMLGHGKKVFMVNFMKTNESGEMAAIKEKLTDFHTASFGLRGCKSPERFGEEDKEQAKKGLERAREAIRSEAYDMVILDEACVAAHFGLIRNEDLIGLIEEKPEMVEIVLTGRNASQDLIERADLVSEIREVKHPYKKGLSERQGIEY